jgi:hypothetical protein
MWAAVATAVLGLVFIGSIVNQLQLPRWERLVARFDVGGLLPYWGFFAPDPGHAGNHLVYRDRTAGSWGPWRELSIPDPRPRTQWLWNPARFERKALLDLLNGFAKAQQTLREAGAMQLSVSYLGMLSWVMAQPRPDARAQTRQFAVIATTGHQAARAISVVIASNEHRFY